MASEYLSSNSCSAEWDGLCLASISHQTLQLGLDLGTAYPIKNHPMPQFFLGNHGLTCQPVPLSRFPSSPIFSSSPVWPGRCQLSGQRLGNAGQSHPLLCLLWHDDVIFWGNRKIWGAPVVHEGCNLQFLMLFWVYGCVVICSVGITKMTQVVGSLVPWH